MKTTKKDRSQVSHIKSPTIDKSGDKAKKGKIRVTSVDTENKVKGHPKKLGIKLKKGK